MTVARRARWAFAACSAALVAACPALAEPAAPQRDGIVRLAQANQAGQNAGQNANEPRDRGRRNRDQGGQNQKSDQQGGARGNRQGGQPGAPPNAARGTASRPGGQTGGRTGGQPPASASTPPATGAPASAPRTINRYAPPPQRTTTPAQGAPPPRTAAPAPQTTQPPSAGTPVVRGTPPATARTAPANAPRIVNPAGPSGAPPQVGRGGGAVPPATARTSQPPATGERRPAGEVGRGGFGERRPNSEVGRSGFGERRGPGGDFRRRDAGRPGRPGEVIAAPQRRDNRWRNRAIVGGAVVGGAAVLGAIALDKARAEAAERRDRDRDRYRSIEDIRGSRREETRGGTRYQIEHDRRRIVRSDRGLAIRYDEREWLRRVTRDRGVVRRSRDGTTTTIIRRPGGIEIVSVTDEYGRLLRRVRRFRDGREVVLIDTGRRYWPRRGYRVPAYAFLDIAPPEVRIPRSRYIVEYRDASVEDIYEALAAPPVAELDRGYSLDEIRDTYALRQYMPRVDLDLITFDFGRFEIAPEQYDRLDRIARAIRRLLEQSPDEVIMIEGHTDAVGNSEDNLSLSDRRAEEVARVLIEGYGIPAENLVTQGYGEQFLKVRTSEAERANRRVAVLRITPLLDRGDENETSDNRRYDREDDRDDDRGDDRRPPRRDDGDERDEDGRPQNSGPLGGRRF